VNFRNEILSSWYLMVSARFFKSEVVTFPGVIAYEGVPELVGGEIPFAFRLLKVGDMPSVHKVS
jgi:hypothetical protein